MEILRILIVLVLMMMWKETSNQKIERKDVNERIKRYHESDLVGYNKRVEQVKHEKEKKKVPIESTNPQVGLKPESALFYNPRKGNTVITPQQLLRINQANNKNLLHSPKPYVTYVPKYDIDNKRIDNGTKVSETLVNDTANREIENELTVDETKDVKEKKKILDTMSTEKAFEIIELLKNLENPLRELKNVKLQEREIVKKKRKLKSKNKGHHHHRPHKNRNTPGEESDESNTENSGKIDKPLLDDKLVIKPTTEQISPGKIKFENENKSDGNVNNFENDTLHKSIEIKKEQVVLPKQDNEIQPKKHPFLDAIQNDHYTTSFGDIAPILKEIKVTETNVDGTDIKIENDSEIMGKSASDLPNEVDLTKDNDKSGEIIIKNNNFEEIMEVAKPIAPLSYQVEKQNNKAPVLHENYRQAPNYNQILRTQFYNPNYNRHAPDEQQIVPAIDGSTVVSYNNYFKLPTRYDNSDTNNNAYPYNNNQYYGYGPTSQTQNRDGYAWRNGRGYYQNYGNAKDRIWRSWKNTEYHLKSKSDLNKIDSENINNLITQNEFADNAKKGNVGMNGYYRNQNNLP